MINTPSNYGQDWETIVSRARKNIIDKLNRILNTTIEHHIVFENILDPRSIESKTGSYKGSLYGTASNKRKAAFLDIQTFLKIFKAYIFAVVVFILEAGFHWHCHRLKL